MSVAVIDLRIYLFFMQEDAISPAIKAEFEEWGTKTTGGVLAGMLYGGAREAASAAVNFSSLTCRSLLGSEF